MITFQIICVYAIFTNRILMNLLTLLLIAAKIFRRKQKYLFLQ